MQFYERLHHSTDELALASDLPQIAMSEDNEHWQDDDRTVGANLVDSPTPCASAALRSRLRPQLVTEVAGVELPVPSSNGSLEVGGRSSQGNSSRRSQFYSTGYHFAEAPAQLHALHRVLLAQALTRRSALSEMQMGPCQTPLSPASQRQPYVRRQGPTALRTVPPTSMHLTLYMQRRSEAAGLTRSIGVCIRDPTTRQLLRLRPPWWRRQRPAASTKMATSMAMMCPQTVITAAHRVLTVALLTIMGPPSTSPHSAAAQTLPC